MKKTLLSSILFFAVSLCPFIITPCYAGSATWDLNPTSSDWNTAANWMPATVPNGPTDVATFAGSNITGLRFSAATTEVAAMVFNPGASSFNITADSSLAQTTVTLSISGPGLTNNSGVTQKLTAGPTVRGEGGIIEFLNAATAGDGTALTALGSASNGAFGGGLINFHDTSTAGTATIVAEGATGRDDAEGGEVNFFDNATAGNASFTATGAVTSTASGGQINFKSDSTAGHAIFTTENGTNGGSGGQVIFSENSEAGNAQFIVPGGEVRFIADSSAADATFTIEGAAVPGTVAGSVSFEFGSTAGNGIFIVNGGSTANAVAGELTFDGSVGRPTAGNATLIANSGTNGGDGGEITFEDEADGGEARIELFGNGSLSISDQSFLSVGSIEGDGLVLLKGADLITGSNDLSTTFSGTIQDNGLLEKVGSGTLTLSAANTYTGGTTVSQGTLLVTNLAGSGTGTGTVQVNGGTLGGGGTVSGAITVGTGASSGAVLDPAATDKKIVILVTQSTLTILSNATYRCTIDFKNSKSTAVKANGVTLNNGPTIVLTKVRNGTLAQGKVFKIISNTSANPISGTFSNLADGAIVKIGGTNFQADYQGGDGNDLTLTVVP